MSAQNQIEIENIDTDRESFKNEIEQIPGTPIISYSTTSQSITKLRKRFAHLINLEKIEGGKNGSSYISIKIAISELTGLRSLLETERKKQKKVSLDFGRGIDNVAKNIEEAIQSMETPLRDLRKKVDDDENRIKQEKIEAEEKRINDIRNMIEKITNLKNSDSDIDMYYTADKLKEFIASLREKQSNLNEEIYQEFTTEMKTALAETIEILDAKLVKREKRDDEEKERKAENERLAKQKIEQDVAQKKLDDEREKFEQKQREAARKEEAQRREKLAAEKAKQDEQEKKEEAKKHEEEAQRREKLAAEKAKQDELDRIKEEQEKKEANERLKCEAEKKRIDMLPDKEKLLEFYHQLCDFWVDISPMESLNNDESEVLLNDTAEIYRTTIAGFIKKANKL